MSVNSSLTPKYLSESLTDLKMSVNPSLTQRYLWIPHWPKGVSEPLDDPKMSLNPLLTQRCLWTPRWPTADSHYETIQVIQFSPFPIHVICCKDVCMLGTFRKPFLLILDSILAVVALSKSCCVIVQQIWAQITSKCFYFEGRAKSLTAGYCPPPLLYQARCAHGVC